MNLPQYIAFKQMESPHVPVWTSMRYRPGDKLYVRTRFGLERAVVLMVVKDYHVHREGLPERYIVRLHSGETVEVTHEQITG